MTSHRSIARHLVPERHAAALRELGIFGVAYLVYFGVRAVTEGTAATAMHNAMDLIRLEQRLGIAWEGAIQEGIVGSRLLVDAATAVYIYGHWPVIILTGALLFRHHRDHYYRLRNACLLSGLIGLAIFGLYPVAAPLTDLPLVDTVTRSAEGYRQVLPAGPRQLVRGDAELPRRLERAAGHRGLPGHPASAAPRARGPGPCVDGRRSSSPTGPATTWSGCGGRGAARPARRG